ncbi:MAG: carbon starvation CstA family protein [Bacteroidota bacterium]
MISLGISILILVFGYFIYSKYIEKEFGADGKRATPGVTMTDGVDYLPMSWWRVFLIQFLNIAGLGPIFGAVAGAMWGPVAFLWIILGAVFAWVVNESANVLLGKFGAFLAILGVVAAPITSGDTAFWSARLIVADFLNLKQGPLKNRLYISIPLFAIGFLLTQINFDVVWRYFAWSNQTLATVVLWTITVYLVKYKKNFWISFIPALFMTAVVSTYLFLAPEGFHLSKAVSYSVGSGITILTIILFAIYYRNERKIKSFHN